MDALQRHQGSMEANLQESNARSTRAIFVIDRGPCVRVYDMRRSLYRRLFKPDLIARRSRRRSSEIINVQNRVRRATCAAAEASRRLRRTGRWRRFGVAGDLQYRFRLRSRRGARLYATGSLVIRRKALPSRIWRHQRSHPPIMADQHIIHAMRIDAFGEWVIALAHDRVDLSPAK